jgi:hypothetical protein
MKETQMRELSTRGRLFSWIAAAVLIAGCQSIQLVSDYDESTDKGATELQRKMSDFFTRLQTFPRGSADLRFDRNQEFDRQATVDLNALQVRAGGIRMNQLTLEQLQLVEDNLALLVLTHKGCMVGLSNLTSEERDSRQRAMREEGVDLTMNCRISHGAVADLSDRGDQVINPAFVSNAWRQFDQGLGAVMAFELAKRRGENAKQ